MNEEELELSNAHLAAQAAATQARAGLWAAGITHWPFNSRTVRTLVARRAVKRYEAAHTRLDAAWRALCAFLDRKHGTEKYDSES